MEVPRLIEQNADYNILETEFNGHSLQLRIWHKGGVTEVKFDDNFALANSFLSLEDLLDKIENMRKYLLQTFGCIPGWITVDPDTDFIGFPLLNTQTKVSFN